MTILPRIIILLPLTLCALLAFMWGSRLPSNLPFLFTIWWHLQLLILIPLLPLWLLTLPFRRSRYSTRKS